MTLEEAIKTLETNYPDACFEQLREAVDAAIEALKAQDAAGDTISRAAAIEAILSRTNCKSVRDLYEYNAEHDLHMMWTGGIVDAIDMVIGVPSAEQEDCSTCKHGYFGSWQCNNCRVRYPSHYERCEDEGSD